MIKTIHTSFLCFILMQRILQRIRLQVCKQELKHKKIVNEFVHFNANVRTKFVVVFKALIDKI
jgi:hypothetical protein